MSKYPKINSLWKREMKGNQKGKIIEGEYSCPEFKNIRLWRVSEKIHGRNTRIEFHVIVSKGKVSISNIEFKGRSDDSDIPSYFVKYLMDTFTPEQLSKMVLIRLDKHTEDPLDEEFDVTLYGEGYGAKMQKGGGRYRDNASFALFDVNINGWWLERENVEDIANKLDIDIVPEMGIMTEEEIISLVKNTGYKLKGFKSRISKDKTLDAEGIVARSYPLVLFKNGDPLMWKLKQEDFNK
ncbi:MAG: RNA ligase family protein [Atribacterota bacterium]